MGEKATEASRERREQDRERFSFDGPVSQWFFLIILCASVAAIIKTESYFFSSSSTTR